MDNKGKANEKLRDMLKEYHIPFWKLGVALGVSEQTVVRWFRTPLTPERTFRVRMGIDKIYVMEHQPTQ